MTSPTTQSTFTVRTILLDSGPEGDTATLQRALSEHDLMRYAGRTLSRLTQDARAVSEETLASTTAGLLNLDLGDLLIHGWRTHERLINAAKRTLAAPGRQEVVQLGSHRITSTYHPTIDLLVDGVRVHTFRFRLTVVFDIDVAVATVECGRLVAVRFGDGSIATTLILEMTSGDIELVRHQSPIDLHLIIRLGGGLPLLSCAQTSAPEPGMPSNWHWPRSGT
jgi:hypothetical protein